MNVIQQETIWFPDISGIYKGRMDSDYTKLVADISVDDLIELVQKRAQEDGEWAIANGHVGEHNEHEDKMRRMMEWVSKLENIKQCVEHIYKDGLENKRTVDFVCRDLANASKWAVK